MRSVESPLPAERSLSMDLSARIQNKHRGELNDLRHVLTAPSWRDDPLHRGRRQHRLGPMPSFEDVNANLTIVAETVELAWFAVGPAPAGTCLTVSIAAHQKNTGIQTPPSLTECDAWMRALLGDPWMAQTYRCRCSSGAASESVVSYRLFLDGMHKPAAKPDEVMADGCQLLSAQIPAS